MPDNITALWKSHYSLGKSILNLEDSSEPEKSDSIFQIAKDEGLKEITLVEDSMGGFLQAYKNSKKLGIKLNFGLRLSFVNDLTQSLEDRLNSSHKNIIFIKNEDGYKRLIKIYSKAATEFYNKEPQIDYNECKNLWDDKDLLMAVPFYDSFLMNNLLTNKACIPNYFTEPQTFEEDNNHPFDFILSDKLKSLGVKTDKVKSIYYRNKADFQAWQTFKLICNRTYGNMSLSRPNLENCCSSEFSYESFKGKI